MTRDVNIKKHDVATLRMFAIRFRFLSCEAHRRGSELEEKAKRYEAQALKLEQKG